MPVLHLVSANLRSGLGPSGRRCVLPALRDELAASGADLVLLQEVAGEHRRHAARHATWPSGPVTAYLAAAAWPHHAYGPNAMHADGHLGNALLSRMPIARWGNHDVSTPHREPRGLLHAEIDGDGTRLHVVCVHLGLREAERAAQVARLGGLLAQSSGATPVVVAGDFNDWRGCADTALRALGLRDAYAEHRGARARTFPAVAPLLPLDRVYVRGPVRVLDARVLRDPWRRLSDHAALSVRLDVGDGARNI